jgi:GNAT superfamily N-acetyltransferase
MKIRKANANDVKDIAEILVSSWRFAYKGIMSDELLSSLSVDSRAEGWKKHLDLGAEAWVLQKGEATLGVTEFGKFRDSIEEFNRCGEIYLIYLRPEEIGKGLGSKLLNHCFDNLRSQGFNRVAIWVLEQNSRAIDFYKCFAFSYSGVSKTHASTGLIENLYCANT